MHFLEFSRLDQKPTNLVYFETVSAIILVALWTMCTVWTTSVLLWTIAVINFNHALENLRTKGDFNFTSFLLNSDEVLYETRQSLLLSQSGFKQLLSEIVTDKFH